MKDNNLVSIIMTCHNGELFLRDALSSIFKQTYKNWELIFYDNCSTDKSADLVNEYKDSRIKYFKSEKLINLGAIRKLSFEKCNGDFISFLDVDDYWSEKKLSNGYCQSDIIYSYINGLPLTAWLTLMIRKSAIDKLEYSFDKNLHISSDFDLIIRLSDFCYFDFIDDYLAFYRLHFFNESKNKNREIEELAYILMKHKDNKKINFLFNKNNFADKIFIKNFLLQENSDKFRMNYMQINNKFFMLLYFIISIIPKKILNIFYK